MTLERAQSRDNSTNEIIANAGLVGQIRDAGKVLGLTEQEAIATLSRTYRKQKRADDATTKQDVLRNFLQSANTLREFAPDDTKYLDTDEVAAAFGQMQDDSQTYRADDRGFTEDEETGLVRREKFEEQKPLIIGEFESVGTRKNYGRRNKGDLPYTFTERAQEGPVGYEGTNAPRSALQDALNQLQQGVQTYGYDAFPGSRDAESALEDDLRFNRESESSVGRSEVKSDRAARKQRAIQNLRTIAIAQKEAGRPLSKTEALQLLQEMSPAGARKFSDENTFRESQRIAREGFLTGGARAFADEAIGRIGEIRNLAKTGEPATVQRVMPADEAIRTQVTQRSDGIYLDEAGNPVAIQGPELGPTPPGPQTARQFVVDLTSGEGKYPQTDITRETTNLVTKYRDFLRKKGIQSQTTSSATNVRSIDELQALSNRMQQIRKEKNMPTLKLDTSVSPPRGVAAGQEYMSAMMYDLGMSKPEQEGLAHALYQLDAAKRSSVNQNPTGTYLSRLTKAGSVDGDAEINKDGRPTVMFDSGRAMITDPTTVEFDRLKFGTASKETGKDLKTAIQGLSSVDAAKPFIALDPNRPTQKQAPLSTFLGSQVYNRTRYPKGSPKFKPNAMVQTTPEGIRNFLTEQAVDRGNLRGLEGNISAAQSVQRRTDEAVTDRAKQMSDIIASLPPTARRSPINTPAGQTEEDIELLKQIAKTRRARRG